MVAQTFAGRRAGGPGPVAALRLRGLLRPDRFAAGRRHELGHPEMESCSLVVSGYRKKNKPQGKLAVLGPVRMEYEHIIPALEYISDVLSDFLENIE